MKAIVCHCVDCPTGNMYCALLKDIKPHRSASRDSIVLHNAPCMCNIEH